MAQIQAVTVWKDGVETTATQFSLISIGDNLSTSANFYYQLLEEVSTTQDADGNDVTSGGSVVADGNLTMDGQDYQDWGSQSGTDINEWAYDWAAGKLNLTLV